MQRRGFVATVIAALTIPFAKRELTFQEGYDKIRALTYLPELHPGNDYFFVMPLDNDVEVFARKRSLGTNPIDMSWDIFVTTSGEQVRDYIQGLTWDEVVETLCRLARAL